MSIQELLALWALMPVVELILLGALVFFTAILAGFTLWLAVESSKTRKEAKRPHLSAKLDPSVSIDFLDLVICNTGRGAAYDITFRHDLSDQEVERHDVHVRGNSSPINFLLPSESDRYFFGVTHKLFDRDDESNRLREFTVRLDYSDCDGTRYSEACEISVLMFKGLAWIQQPTSKQARAMEKLVSIHERALKLLKSDREPS